MLGDSQEEKSPKLANTFKARWVTKRVTFGKKIQIKGAPHYPISIY
jgi:hypothetical protein